MCAVGVAGSICLSVAAVLESGFVGISHTLWSATVKTLRSKTQRVWLSMKTLRVLWESAIYTCT